MSGRRFRFSHVLTSATAAVALLACGSSPPPKPAETVQAAPKVEKVVGVPDAAVKAFNAGVTALEQTPPDYAAASGHFDAATQAYPAYDAAWLNLAFCYGKSGRHVDAAVGRRRLAQQGVHVQQARPVTTADVVNQLRAFRREHPHALLELGEEEALAAPHQLRKALTCQYLAAVGGVVDAFDTPLGVSDLNPQAGRQLLAHCFGTPYRKPLAN